MDIILASKSLRRQELLGKIVNDFKIVESNFDETTIKFNGNPEEYVKTLAFNKAKEVANKLENTSIIISADTVVVLENKILGKPKNKKDAECMLRSLSGNNHKVYTGVCVLDTATNTLKQEAVLTEVKFGKLTNKVIQEYIDTGDPMDKAGAYGIQGFAAVFVEKINGCYYNVMGLPLNVLYNMLNS